jgi:hypothetical protein
LILGGRNMKSEVARNDIVESIKRAKRRRTG